jgi:hypothetical protein
MAQKTIAEKHKIDAKTHLKQSMQDFKDNRELDEDGRKDLYRTRWKNCSYLRLAHAQEEAQQVKDYVDALAKFVNAEFDTIRNELLPAAMEDEGIESCKIEGLGRVSLTGDMWVRTQNAVQLMKWLGDEGLGDLIKDSVASSTLKACLKERMEAGKPMPGDDIVKVTPYTRASITHSK